jgi:hypothetical protein
LWVASEGDAGAFAQLERYEVNTFFDFYRMKLKQLKDTKKRQRRGR